MQSKLTYLKDATAFFRKELTNVYGTGELNAISRVFWEDVFGFTTSELILNEGKEITENEYTILLNAVKRLKKHEPIQHVTGFTWFADMKIGVTADVLIPRPETEDLIHTAIGISKTNYPEKIIDIGTGSGCIALALKKHFGNTQVDAVDISDKALAVANRNADNLQLKVDFQKIDFLNNAATSSLGTYDLICSNPPYIADAEKAKMESNVLDYEPAMALFVPDDDPLIFYRNIAKFGLTHLRKKGTIICEINEFLSHETVQLFQQMGYSQVELVNDLFCKPRIVTAQR